MPTLKTFNLTHVPMIEKRKDAHEKVVVSKQSRENGHRQLAVGHGCAHKATAECGNLEAQSIVMVQIPLGSRETDDQKVESLTG